VKRGGKGEMTAQAQVPGNYTVLVGCTIGGGEQRRRFWRTWDDWKGKQEGVPSPKVKRGKKSQENKTSSLSCNKRKNWGKKKKKYNLGSVKSDRIRMDAKWPEKTPTAGALQLRFQGGGKGGAEGNLADRSQQEERSSTRKSS